MSVDFKSIIIFDNKTFEDLIKEIYTKAEKKSGDFDVVIKQLIQMAIDNPAQAVNIMPILAEYSEVSIKNDDSLIKIANIIQRFHSKSISGPTDNDGDWKLTQEEIDDILTPKLLIDIPEPTMPLKVKEMTDVSSS